MDEEELVSELFGSLLAAVDEEQLSDYPQLGTTLKQAICKKGLSKKSSLSLLMIIEKLASYRVGMIDEYSFRVALKGYGKGEWLHPHSPTHTPQELAELLLERSGLVAMENNNLSAAVSTFPTPPLSVSPEQKEAGTPPCVTPNLDTPTSVETELDWPTPSDKMAASAGTPLESSGTLLNPSVGMALNSPMGPPLDTDPSDQTAASVGTPVDSLAPSEPMVPNKARMPSASTFIKRAHCGDNRLCTFGGTHYESGQLIKLSVCWLTEEVVKEMAHTANEMCCKTKLLQDPASQSWYVFVHGLHKQDTMGYCDWLRHRLANMTVPTSLPGASSTPSNSSSSRISYTRAEILCLKPFSSPTRLVPVYVNL